jgi:2-hydroxychromene-2-carboxylate isomerase
MHQRRATNKIHRLSFSFKNYFVHKLKSRSRFASGFFISDVPVGTHSYTIETLKIQQTTMPAPIDFYFDFSSPYGYLASTRIDALAARHGREVNWRPILLGPAFKASGNAPLVGQPLKGAYSVRDFIRTAKHLGIPFNMPSPFPIGTQNAARAFYWLGDRDMAQAKKLAQAFFNAFYVLGRDISSTETVVDIAAANGVDAGVLGTALADPAVKDRLRNEVEASLARGVFGSPYFIIDGEPFWGNDRLDQMDAWLKTGGW